MSDDPLGRLARANPVAPGSLTARGAPGTPGGRERRRPRRPRWAGPALAALGMLAVTALIGALLIAAPGDDPAGPATPPFDGTLRVSLLDRPQAPEDVTTPPQTREPPLEGGAIDPASTRLAVDRGPESWFAGRRVSDPTSVCMWHTEPSVDLGCHGMSPLERTGLLLVRWLPDGLTQPLDALVSEFVGIAPDGIESVTVGDETVPVVDNVFVVRIAGPPPDTLVASGAAAPALPRTAPGVAVFTRSGSAPAVALALVWSGASPEMEPGGAFTTGTPGDAPAAPPPNPVVRGSLDAAAAAMPFVVLVPDRPPPGARTVLWSRDDPRLTPQTTISYISQGARTGVTIIQAAEGATPVGDAVVERPVRHAGRQMYVVEPGAGGAGLRVRVVIDGTDARISGGDLTEERALAIAASLNPVESPAP